MRSLCAPFAVVAVLAFATGCEDGPNQPYSPAPAGAGSVWSAPQSDAAVGPGAQNFDAGYPTTGATTLCSVDFKRQRWAWMLTQPITPPRFYAGIDLAGGDNWNGLSIQAAEAPPPDPNAADGGLCQSIPLGAGGTCPSGIGSCNGSEWGYRGEVGFSWNVATHILDQMTINLGYTGAFQTGKYPDHNGEVHAYALAPGDVARRDGQPFLLDWDSSALVKQEITDIFNAGMATFASQAGIAWDTSSCMADTDCSNAEVCQCTHATDSMGNPTSSCAASNPDGSKGGKCGDKNCGSDGYCLVYPPQWIFGIRPIAFYVQGTAGVPQPALSTPTGFYNFWVKWEPFSYLPQNVELGPNGPTTYGNPTGAKDPMAQCNQRVGQTFGDFTTNCVAVHGDMTSPNSVDKVNLNKVLNGLTHDQEHWTANVLGVNQNFTSLKVAHNPNIVVQDNDTPQMGDVAQDWTYDVRARGATDNEVNPTTHVEDDRASSLIVIEWARLMLADIAKITGKQHTLMDNCTGFAGDGVTPNYLSDPTCSGIEGMIVPGTGGTGTDFSLDPVRPDLNPCNAKGECAWDSIVGWWSAIVKPAQFSGALCIDPASQTDCDYAVIPNGVTSVWQNCLNHVVRVMGHGNIHSLPEELQDVRYYLKWFGVAFVKYLKAYANYRINYPGMENNFPSGGPGVFGTGLGPSDVMTQPIDLESLFFDYLFQTGVGEGQTFDKFEYVDRDFIGKGAGGSDCSVPDPSNPSAGFPESNCVPWDFEYGTDILGGNQRYDNWYRRMDREEIGLYSAMLEDKTKTPGQENNVNVTNLAGSKLLGSTWPTWQCATGQYGDPTQTGGNECGGGNPPLDPSFAATAACAGTQIPVVAQTYENGYQQFCANACDYSAATGNPATGCKDPAQACVLGVAGAGAGCVNMKMDRNGPYPCTDATGAPVSCAAPSVVVPRPLLWRYPSAWSRSPFGLGHSPITLKQADKQPGIGVAKISIPNFADQKDAMGNVTTQGPYVNSPIAPSTGSSPCPMGYTLSANKVWCNAATESGTGTLAPAFTPLTPWLEVGGGETVNGGPVGFSIPEDGNRDQFLTTGQIDFTGVLESYVVDYVPWQDPVQPSCVTTGACNAGYTCDPHSNNCVTDDDTIRIEAIEGQDFLGQVFMCQDPSTGDILHLGMYDSAASTLTWLSNHPGSFGGLNPSAQVACGIIVRTSPYDNAVDRMVSLTTGVNINFSGGQGQGRVTDVVVFDPNLIQALN